MIENLKDSPEEFKEYDSELLLKILNKTSKIIIGLKLPICGVL